MTSRREPLADPIRGREIDGLARAWFYIGLVVALLCCVTAPGSVSALVSGSFSSGVDAPTFDAERQALAVATDGPRCGHDNYVRRAAQELGALETQTEQEDATSDTQVVGSAFELDRDPSGLHVRALKRPLTGDFGHLLVSTGLGRGPPIG